MALTPEQRSLRASAAVYSRWAREDPRPALAHARKGWRAKFEARVDPDGTLDPAERERRTQALINAEMCRLAFRSSLARSKRPSAERKAAER